MTNSEIKKDELKPCPFCGVAAEIWNGRQVLRHRQNCFLGSHLEIPSNWVESYNTRTPEPTKAENGLVLDALEYSLWKLTNTYEYIHQGYETKPDGSNWHTRETYRNTEEGKQFQVAIDKCNNAISYLKSVGTPSITKEQLLAILPEKRNRTSENQHNGDIAQEHEDYGYNAAIDQMKQRIEELWKNTGS